MLQKTFTVLAVVLLMPVPAAADPESFELRVRACASVADDSERLACYDRAANASTAVAEKTETTPAPDAAPVTASGMTPASAAEAAPVEALGMTAASAAEAAPVDEFGMTPELARSKPGYDENAELREMTATVVDVRKRLRGELVVTLDNGQVWTEKDAEYGFRVKVGDTVLIKKGNLGGYRMVGRGRRASDVRRIN